MSLRLAARLCADPVSSSATRLRPDLFGFVHSTPVAAIVADLCSSCCSRFWLWRPVGCGCLWVCGCWMLDAICGRQVSLVTATHEPASARLQRSDECTSEHSSLVRPRRALKLDPSRSTTARLRFHATQLNAKPCTYRHSIGRLDSRHGAS